MVAMVQGADPDQLVGESDQAEKCIRHYDCQTLGYPPKVVYHRTPESNGIQVRPIRGVVSLHEESSKRGRHVIYFEGVCIRSKHSESSPLDASNEGGEYQQRNLK